MTPVVSTHESVPLSDRCWCGEDEPFASVSWFDVTPHLPDSEDACPTCLPRVIADAQSAVDGGVVDVEVRDGKDEAAVNHLLGIREAVAG